MRPTFAGHLWTSFRRVQGILGLLFSFAVAVAFYFARAGWTVSVGVALPLGLFALLLVATLLDASLQAFSSSGSLPRTLQARKNADGRLLCLLEASEQYSIGIGVSFYYTNADGFEVLVGLGQVINVQHDGRVQALMTTRQEGQDEVVDRLLENSKSHLDRLVVKPSIPIAFAG